MAGFSALTTAGGPLLGGWLVDEFSWRAVFWSIIPLAVTLWRVQESRDDEGEARLDAWGVLLATAGLGAMKYGLVALSDLGWGHVAVLASASAAHSS